MSANAGTSEFWRGIKPIPDSFKPDTLPEVHIANAPTEDEPVPYFTLFYSVSEMRSGQMQGASRRP